MIQIISINIPVLLTHSILRAIPNKLDGVFISMLNNQNTAN